MAKEFNGTGFAQHAQGPRFSEKNQSINKQIKVQTGTFVK